LKIVSNEISRIEKIIRQALDVLTLDRGKVEAIDIRELLSEIVDFMLPSLSRDAETIELVVDPDLKIVYSDGDMLREVVINLIANANESMEGKGFIRLSAGRRDDNKCYISVTDTGVGIPKELQEKIFEPFFTTKQKGRASGLGLTISKEIARLLGGDIEVESVVGKGSTFTFTFADRREGPDEEVTDIGGR
jgi:signal transduction histidine kinase